MAKKIYKINHMVDISNVDFLKESIEAGADTIQEGPNTYFFCETKAELDKLVNEDRREVEGDGLVVTKTNVKELTTKEYLDEAFNDFISVALLKNIHSVDSSLTVEEGIEEMKKDDIKVCEAVNTLLEDLRVELDEELFENSDILE